MKHIFKLFLFSAAFLFLITACNDDDEEAADPGAPEVTTLEVTEITESEAKSGGDVTSDGGAPVSARGVVWGLEQSPSLDNNLGLTVDGGGLGIFTSSITGLSSGETYFVRAYATNPGGTAYGQQIEFTALSPSIASLNCDDITTEGTLTEGISAAEVFFSIPYSGGDGSNYEGQTLSSTGLAGLTASLQAGTFANGSGTLTYTITGTPSNSGSAGFTINIGGQSCQIFLQVKVQPVYCLPGGAPTAVVEVLNPSTGKIWMDRNLGASQAATSSTDEAAYGDLYQWGRFSDGHQCRNSEITNTLSSSIQPEHGDFIGNLDNWLTSQNDNLWQGVNGTNNPCPEEFRLPTEAELDAERESWNNTNAAGAFSSPLKFTMAGSRGSFGSIAFVGESGSYWSSGLSGFSARLLNFNSGFSIINTFSRSPGLSVRCIKD